MFIGSAFRVLGSEVVEFSGSESKNQAVKLLNL